MRKPPLAMSLFFVVLTFLSTALYASSNEYAFPKKPIALDRLVDSLFKDPCDQKLLRASKDPKEALKLIRSLEHQSGRVFDNSPEGFLNIIPVSGGSWTLWIQLDSIGLKNITETWYYNDTKNMVSDYETLFQKMLTDNGEPLEDDYDFALWEGYLPNCPRTMLLIEHVDKYDFISRRVMFR